MLRGVETYDMMDFFDLERHIDSHFSDRMTSEQLVCVTVCAERLHRMHAYVHVIVRQSHYLSVRACVYRRVISVHR